MTDKLISDLTAIGAAIADTTVFEAQRSGEVTTEKAAGTDLTTYVGSKNLSYLADAATARNNIGGIFPISDPDFNDSQVYLCTPTTGPAAGTMSALRLDMTPIWVPRTRQYTTYAIVVTALSASTGIRLGLYNANSSMQPTTKIDEAASVIDTSTGTGSTGLKTVAFSANQTLKPGLYFLAALSDGAPTVVRLPNVGSFALGMRFASSSVSATGARARAGVAYTTLPADETAETYSSQASLGAGIALPGIR